MTSRGFDEQSFEQVADYITTALQIAQSVQNVPMTLKTFAKKIEANKDLEKVIEGTIPHTWTSSRIHAQTQTLANPYMWFA